jgi:hypothetical protein
MQPCEMDTLATNCTNFTNHLVLAMKNVLSLFLSHPMLSFMCAATPDINDSKQKHYITQEAIEVKNVLSTATKYKIQPCQVRS